MARSLAMQRATVPLGERPKYFERLRVKRAYFTKANCRFWVFEESALPGAFVEFIESNDPGTLASALAGASDFILDPSRIYTELEMDS